MPPQIHVDVALSHPFVPATLYSEEPLYALLQTTAVSTEGEAVRPSLNIVFVIDASGTMNHFQLTEEELEYWTGLGISRNEIERGSADSRSAYLWRGNTLKEMQKAAPTPMTQVVTSLKKTLQGLQPGDNVAVIVFANQAFSIISAGDWAAAPTRCLKRLDALCSQRLPVDIGNGTCMADALRLGQEKLQDMSMEHPQSLLRMVIISDGMVQDQDATLSALHSHSEQEATVTTIGVGQEFDEEFLMRLADLARGDYHYAADNVHFGTILEEAMTDFDHTLLSNVLLRVRGLNGTVVQDCLQVSPAMSPFEEVTTEDGWMQARLGGIGARPVGILIEMLPARKSVGPHPIAEVILESNGVQEQVFLTATFSDDPSHLAVTNRSVLLYAERLAVYRHEREAQRALLRGDHTTARVHLSAASEKLLQLGEPDLAAEMASQSKLFDNPAQSKRIKATTRRLNAPRSDPPAP